MADTIPAGTPGTHPDIETIHYPDGSSATGPAPLPRCPSGSDRDLWIEGFVAGCRLHGGDGAGYREATDRYLSERALAPPPPR